ncbi:hypothetical protein ACFQJ7_07630 [Halovenus rubra]|uniref:Uncharacterized protein n=2 Tax=Halovenus rubra TaxID=869890 RepID=A0ABD5X458_9EURY|nr:hypothetical protein [Halovenus rubra]
MGERSYDRDATVSADGITVYQLYTEDEFESPAVVLKLVSMRPERTSVQLRLPNVDADRIGFHPDFEAESWTIGEDYLTFEAEIDPDTTLTTLYLIQNGDEATATQTLEGCEITAVTPVDSLPTNAETDDSPPEEQVSDASEPSDTSDALSASGFESTHDQENKEAETAEIGTNPDDILVDPEDELSNETADPLIDAEDVSDSVDSDSETETGSGNHEESEPTDDDTTDLTSTLDESLVDETVEPQSSGDERDTTTEMTASSYEDDNMTTQDSDNAEMTAHEQDETDVSSVSTDELVAELRTRLDEGELSEQQRRQLGTVDPATSGGSGAHDARIANLQSRMSDIEAFSASMEAVLEQHGAPAEVFGEFQDRLDRVESEVGTLSDDVETNTEWQETVEPRLGSVEQEVDDVSEDVTAMEETVDDLEAEVSTLQSWREKVTGALKMFTDD